MERYTPFAINYECNWAPLVAQTVKSLPTMQEILVLSLGQERSPGEGNASHSSSLALRIPWTVACQAPQLTLLMSYTCHEYNYANLPS